MRLTSGSILRNISEPVRVRDDREKGAALSVGIEAAGGGACTGGVTGNGVTGPLDTGSAGLAANSLG